MAHAGRGLIPSRNGRSWVATGSGYSSSARYVEFRSLATERPFIAWVGFELLRGDQVGISQRRADQFMRWTRSIDNRQKKEHMTNFEDWSREDNVVGAMDNERPFLGPLRKLLSSHPRGAARRIPAGVSSMIAFRRVQLESSRHSCESSLLASDTSPMVDARASGSRTGVGRRFLILDDHGTLDNRRSLWFSLEVTSAPFFTSSAHLYTGSIGCSLGVDFFCGEEPPPHRVKVQIM